MGGKDRAPICTWHVNLRDRDTRAERHMIFMTERDRERERERERKLRLHVHLHVSLYKQ